MVGLQVSLILIAFSQITVLSGSKTYFYFFRAVALKTIQKSKITIVFAAKKRSTLFSQQHSTVFPFKRK